MRPDSAPTPSCSSVDAALAALHRDLGWKRLSMAWAKAEILLGLTAAGCGIVGTRSLPGDVPWLIAPGTCGLSVALIALGGYLALAGHRSHLYRSQARLAAYLLARGADAVPTRAGSPF